MPRPPPAQDGSGFAPGSLPGHGPAPLPVPSYARLSHRRRKRRLPSGPNAAYAPSATTWRARPLPAACRSMAGRPPPCHRGADATLASLSLLICGHASSPAFLRFRTFRDDREPAVEPPGFHDSVHTHGFPWQGADRAAPASMGLCGPGPERLCRAAGHPGPTLPDAACLRPPAPPGWHATPAPASPACRYG